MLNNSIDHSQEVSKIWNEYNKEISNDDCVGANMYENILRHKPEYQSEILDIMFNEGYKKALKDWGCNMYMAKDGEKAKAKQWDCSKEKFNKLASILEKNNIDPMLLREVVEERAKFERMR